ncbi:hypothetical protein Taro_026607 [Colocasia esculenta]|uniref:OTU domain-containing protein n=1 Tax=Colocasia esculenta TaxID=4460 RepID=A0A843VDE5_COLES|nr:hypothetical protein [Colocasia esculenta]
MEADGNCLFMALRRTMGLMKVGARELWQRTVQRFLENHVADVPRDKEAVATAIWHLYSLNLKMEWEIHIVQEIKLLARKADREALAIHSPHLPAIFTVVSSFMALCDDAGVDLDSIEQKVTVVAAGEWRRSRRRKTKQANEKATVVGQHGARSKRYIFFIATCPPSRSSVSRPATVRIPASSGSKGLFLPFLLLLLGPFQVPSPRFGAATRDRDGHFPEIWKRFQNPQDPRKREVPSRLANLPAGVSFLLAVLPCMFSCYFGHAEIDTGVGSSHLAMLIRHLYPQASASTSVGLQYDGKKELSYNIRGKRAFAIAPNGLLNLNIKGRCDVDNEFKERKTKLAAELTWGILNFLKEQDVRLKVGYEVFDKVPYFQLRENCWTLNIDTNGKWSVRYYL